MTDITFEDELSYCVSGEIDCEWNGKKSYANSQIVTFLEEFL
ncbi:hypothetical protein YDYSY3_52010 [Paenibacillus chitinolyticus]|nr:hypothetical protein YDYSY3_52010 [Paenibacillus chitinolyticus]